MLHTLTTIASNLLLNRRTGDDPSVRTTIDADLVACSQKNLSDLKEAEDSFVYSPLSARGEAIASLAVAITPGDATPAEDALGKALAAQAVSQLLTTIGRDDISDLTTSTKSHALEK